MLNTEERIMKMKRVIALSLAVLLMISMLSACGKDNDNTNTDTKNDSSAKGRYLESEIALPKEVQRILDVQLLDDGTIGAVTINDKDTMTLWSSKDIGATWEQQYDVPFDKSKEEYIAYTALSADKTVLAIVYSDDLPETAMGGIIWEIDDKGAKSEININLPEIEIGEGGASARGVVMQVGEEDATGGEMSFEFKEEATEGASTEDSEEASTEDGEEASMQFEFNSANMQDAIWSLKVGANKEVLAQTVMGKLLRVDIATGEVLQEYKAGEEEYINGFNIVDGDVYIETDRGLKRYDLETGDSKEIAESLSAKFISDDDDTNAMYMQSYGRILTKKSGEEGVVYLIDHTGIYRQSEDGTVLEQIVDASLTSLSMPNTAINKMIALEDDSFLVSVEDGNGGNIIYHYSYSAEAKTTPEQEISIYSLSENREIRQAIAMYQKANPDVMVSMQIGMTGEEGITISDALNKLNTEIMAGNGPDVLLLDGMPIDAYIEKGTLADIGDIVEQVEAQDGILAGVNNNHAIASRISVPYVQGEKRYVDKIKNIDTLKEVSNEIKKDKPSVNSFSGRMIEELMNYLYRVNVTNFITDDGKLEKEKMQNFLARAKEIADDNRTQEEAMDMENTGEVAMSHAMAEGYDVISVAIDLLVEPNTIGRGEIKTIANLATILEVNKKGNMEYGVLTTDTGEKLLLTNTILGINSKSERLKEAKGFLAFCLSKEVQQSDQGLGFPVNKAALNATLYKEMESIGFGMTTVNEEGVEKMVSLEVKQPEKADIEKFENEILGNIKVGYSNQIVQEIIMEQLMGYVEGRATLEEATQAIDQKVSLYLAE